MGALPSCGIHYRIKQWHLSTFSSGVSCSCSLSSFSCPSLLTINLIKSGQIAILARFSFTHASPNTNKLSVFTHRDNLILQHVTHVSLTVSLYAPNSQNTFLHQLQDSEQQLAQIVCYCVQSEPSYTRQALFFFITLQCISFTISFLYFHGVK